MRSPPRLYTPHRLPDADAVCLDGSPATIYVSPGEPPYDRQWLFNFVGGGWCFGEADCVQRASTIIGTSLLIRPDGSKQELKGLGGLIAGSRHAAPFSRFTHVQLNYCDGGSFLGQRPANASSMLGRSIKVRPGQGDTPLAVASQGYAIVRSALRLLTSPRGRTLMEGGNTSLEQAEHVLWGGCSAGALSATLTAGAARAMLRERVPSLRSFAVFSFAGLFFSHLGDEGGGGDSPFALQMRDAYHFHRFVLPDSCHAEHGSNPWRCVLGTAPLRALPADLPAFVEQSIIDRFSSSCVLAAGPKHYTGGGGQSPDSAQLNTTKRPHSAGYAHAYSQGCSSGGWAPCIRYMSPMSPNSTTGCTAGQRRSIHSWQGSAEAELRAWASSGRRGNGAFVHSCSTHCIESSHTWSAMRVGNVSLIEAMRKWWRAHLERHSGGSDEGGKPAAELWGAAARVDAGGDNLFHWPDCEPEAGEPGRCGLRGCGDANPSIDDRAGQRKDLVVVRAALSRARGRGSANKTKASRAQTGSAKWPAWPG